MFGFHGSKPIKDVEKRPAGKSRTSVFFEIFFRKFWRICKLNLLYSIFAIPCFIVLIFTVGILSSKITNFFIPFLAEASNDLELAKVYFDLVLRAVFAILFIVFLGAGPVSAGFSYVLRNFAREDHSWVASDFLGRSRENFAQALIVFLVDIAVFCLLVISFSVYSALKTPVSYIRYVIIFFGILYAMMHLYIYPLMVTFKLSLKDIYKNSVILALANAPKNLVLLAFTAIIHLIIPYYCIGNAMTVFALPLYFILEFVMLEGITGFMSVFFTYPSIEAIINSSDKEE